MEIREQIKIEDKWQKIWKEKKVFTPKIDLRNKEKKYFGNPAYPYANSVLHIGHGRTYTIVDSYLRYQRLTGKNVLYSLGFHISGTPVLAVADGIKRGDMKVIKQTRDAISDYITDKKEQDLLIETFKEPQNIAIFFSEKIEGALDSIGVSIDWTRKFSTGEDIYNKFIEWQYFKLKNLGLLIQDKYPILYSALEENAVGEDDIKDGDTDKVSISNMTAIKFKIVDKDEYILCATLRPDAIFCATNLWVKSDMELVKIQVGEEKWIVSKKSFIKIKHQFDYVKLISEFKGEELFNLKVIAPIINKEISIYNANFCDENHGTGIVYSSPADSPHDYIYLFETLYPNKSLKDFLEIEPLKLTPITQTFDKKGIEINYKFSIPAYDILIKNQIYNSENNLEKLEYVKQELYKQAHYSAKLINAGEFSNLALKNNYAGDKIKNFMFEKNYAVNFYETSRRAKTRNEDDVIVANLHGQWFLNYSDRNVKDKALKLFNSTTFFPNYLRPTMESYIEWVNLRPCARKRGLGTRILSDNNWIIEPLSDSTIYQMLYIISHLIRQYNIKSSALSIEFFEYIYLKNGNKEALINEDLPKQFIEDCENEVNYWNNVDFRYVGVPHMSNHLNFLIYHYSLIFPQSMWPKNLVVGNLMMKDGEKISKSKGNGIPLYRIKNIYGADLYRLYILTNSNYDIEMDFKEKEVLQLEKKFDKLKSLMYSCLSSKNKNYEEFSSIQKWLISKFYAYSENYFNMMNNMKIREAYIGILFEFLNDVSYLERRTNEKERDETLKFILKDWIGIMTPAIPHICEEIYSLANYDGYASTSIFSMDYKKYIDKKSHEIENIIENIIVEISKQKEIKNEIVSKVVLIQAKKSRFELFDNLAVLLSQTKDIKKIIAELNSKFPKDKKFIQKFVPKTLGDGLTTYLTLEKEKELILSAKAFLEKEFSLKVEITDADILDLDSQTIMPRKLGVKLEN